MKRLRLHSGLKVFGLTGYLMVVALIMAGCSSYENCGTNCSEADFPSFSLPRRVGGSGNIVQKTSELSGFSQVELSEEGDLYIEFGKQAQLTIEAEDNLQEFLVPEIDGEVLNIKKDPHNITLGATRPIRYYLTVTSLEALIVKNSGSVSMAPYEGDTIIVLILGSGSVIIESIFARQLTAELTSSGNLTIKAGTVDEQEIRISSSGSYDGRGLASSRAFVRISSSGEAKLHVSELLEVELTSSGNVYYLGNPLISIVASSSEGRVIRGN